VGNTNRRGRCLEEAYRTGKTDKEKFLRRGLARSHFQGYRGQDCLAGKKANPADPATQGRREQRPGEQALRRAKGSGAQFLRKAIAGYEA